MMSKRELKNILKRVRWLCFRCDFNYELTAKQFGLEQTVLLRRKEQPATDDPLCYPLSEALKYLEGFYNDVRTEQKLIRKEDKALRSQIVQLCTKGAMICSFTKRTRLNPPSVRIYELANYEQALGPKHSFDTIRKLLEEINQKASSSSPPVF
jgi:hypothetical protein